jgi:hypothetical protein
MGDKIDYFSAAFRDGRVYIAGKSCSAGNFCVHLMNQYYKHDTAARLSVFRNYNRHVTNMLKAGYLNPTDFVKAGEEIGYMLVTLPDLQPFSLLPTDDERNRIISLFSEENGELLCDYFRRRAKVGLLDSGAVALDIMPKEYDQALFAKCESLLADIEATLHFYDTLGDDISSAFDKLRKFISRLGEAERFDEAHLLPIALDIFGHTPFDIASEYVAIPKSKNSKVLITAHQLCFDSYFSFIVTDFFEGLHYGHYPRQCEICKIYFLMQSARHQKYCNGYSDETYKGKRLTCRKVGALRQNKEKSVDHPFVSIYKSRTGSIRVDKSRGNITEEFANEALKLAKDHLTKAKQEPEYAKKQYPVDMKKDNLYAEVIRILK